MRRKPSGSTDYFGNGMTKFIVNNRAEGRHGGLMVSALDLGASGPGFEPWPGTLCCVLGQDTLLSRCLSSPRCINGYWRI